MFRSFYGFISLLLLGTMAGEFAWAGKYNPTRNIGEAAPEWRELPGVDGRPHSLADYQSYDVLVIAFTCNTCPTAVDYEDRLMALTKQVADGGKCAVIALNANQVADDQLPKMKQRALEKRFNFVYLRDETQQVAKAYGATVTPEFFVLDKQRRIVYMGALDDSTQPAEVKTRYVEEAIAATLAGQKITTAETAPRGCLVRYARERRKKAN